MVDTYIQKLEIMISYYKKIYILSISISNFVTDIRMIVPFDST